MDSYTELTCPYCGEATTCHLEPGQEEITMVIDCEVCCRPMQVDARRDPTGQWSVDVDLG